MEFAGEFAVDPQPRTGRRDVLLFVLGTGQSKTL